MGQNACHSRRSHHFGDTGLLTRPVLRQLPLANGNRRIAASPIVTARQAADRVDTLTPQVAIETKLTQLLKGSSAKDMQPLV
jgi:hypothetical protein